MKNETTKKILRSPWLYFTLLLCMAAAGSGYTADWIRLRTGTLPSTGANGEIRLDSATDKLKKWSDTSGNWQEISGSGGSASFTKWLLNPSGDENATDWNPYQDSGEGSTTTPVNGTGGTTTGIAFVQTVVSGEFYEGSGGFKFSKDGSSRQGGGVSTDFQLEAGFASKSQKIIMTVPYKVTANYASGGVVAFVYDKDGATVQICLNGNSGQFLKSTDWATFQCQFYSTAGNDDYRLILHIADANASAWDMYFKVTGFTNGSPTPTGIVQDLGTEAWTDSQTNATTAVKITRVGKRVFVEGVMSFTGAAVTTATVTIPTAYTPDSTIYPSPYVYKPGVSYYYDASAATTTGETALTAANTLSFFFYNPLGGAVTSIESNITSTNPWTWASGDKITFKADWIVSGWADGNVISSTEALVSTIKFRASGDPASATSGNPYIFPTVVYDTGGGYNTTTGRYTWPKKSCILITGYADSGTGGAGVIAYVNAIAGPQLGKADSTSGDGTYTGSVCVNAGDIVDIRANATIDLASNSTYTMQEIPDYSVFGVYNSVRTVYAYVGTSCTSNPCTVDTSSGVSGISWASTGNYTATFNPPFSTIPACTFSPGGAVNAFAFMAPTTTNVNIIARTVTTTPVAANTNFSIICTGTN